MSTASSSSATPPTSSDSDSISEISIVDPSSLSAINAQLINHGWTKRPLDLSALGEKEHTDVVSALFELLASSLSKIDQLEVLSGRSRTLTYEHERLHKTSGQLRAANARLQSEVEGWRARYANLEKKFALEETKVKELREEAARGRKAIDTVRVAAGHDSKKMQIKLDKANAQLLRISNDATMAAKPQSMVILNPIHPGKGIPVAPGQQPLLEQSLRDLAQIRQSLQEETEAFRHVVVSTANGLREALAVTSGEEMPKRLMHSQFFSAQESTRGPQQLLQSQLHNFQSTSSTSHPSIADARLRALINEVRAKVTAGIPIRVASNGEAVDPEVVERDTEERKRVQRVHERVMKDLEDRVKDLEVEVVCAKAREEEANKLVDDFARAQMEASAVPKGTAGDQEDPELDLMRQRNDLADERRLYKEATTRLDQEWKRFELERDAFLEERRKSDLDAMAGFLPQTPEGGIPPPLPMSVHDLQPIASSSSSSTTPPASPAAWAAYRPSSPSLLSPSAKNRTPRAHMAGGGKRKLAKTPLSRLVLEKAVRQKEVTGVLGEGGRKGNAPAAAAALKVSVRGKKDGAGAGTAVKRDLGKSEGIGPRGLNKSSRAWK